MKRMVKKKTWQRFRQTGLLLIINQILHLFGWAIVVVVDKGKVIDAYPARVRFRGFDSKTVSDSYTKVTKYMKKEIESLLGEVKD